MKTKYTLCVIGCLLVVTLVCTRTDAQRQDGAGEVEERLTTPLKNAGIAINETSLIQALRHKDLLVASRAALLLPRFPKSKRMVQALSSTVTDPREVVAVTAVRSLLVLNETGWVDVAIKRLPNMQDRVSQIQLAGLLAKAGHGDGWQFLSSGLLDKMLYGAALESVSYFDQVMGTDGKRLNVVEELKKLLKRAPDEAHKDIEMKIRELESRGGNQP